MPAGRPIKNPFTQAIAKKILKSLTEGQNLSVAAALVSIPEGTVHNWIQAGLGQGMWTGKKNLNPALVKFAVDVEKAIKMAQAESVKIIRKAAVGDHPKHDPPSKTTTTTEYISIYQCNNPKCNSAMPEGFRGVQCPLCQSGFRRERTVSNVKVMQEHRGSQWTAAAWYLERTDPRKYSHVDRDKVPDASASGRLGELVRAMREGQGLEEKKPEEEKP